MPAISMRALLDTYPRVNLALSALEIQFALNYSPYSLIKNQVALAQALLVVREQELQAVMRILKVLREEESQISKKMDEVTSKLQAVTSMPKSTSEAEALLLAKLQEKYDNLLKQFERISLDIEVRQKEVTILEKDVEKLQQNYKKLPEKQLQDWKKMTTEHAVELVNVLASAQDKDVPEIIKEVDFVKVGEHIKLQPQLKPSRRQVKDQVIDQTEESVHEAFEKFFNGQGGNAITRFVSLMRLVQIMSESQNLDLSNKEVNHIAKYFDKHVGKLIVTHAASEDKMYVTHEQQLNTIKSQLRTTEDKLHKAQVALGLVLKDYKNVTEQFGSLLTEMEAYHTSQRYKTPSNNEPSPGSKYGL